ncbi:2-dehydro-3-deoxy-D-gluconate 5-dehydrogenase KduD [Maritalea mediterranea]|uniref:2-dehydro-3-deoxy-D-gluconate 5-dehydrogenase KduD n=1 Tax=Maritalea mediterranea TaxID=2909667 RepID=A0ABS9E912_9HYPH|nr:2-dehydro-3-deoxy-D-gluconate 5-dehydrogenase KduD [Maritalea mediterranea]MCF4099351.1 2-dehydro-3-deoxy-D-gluconate 5-dehydrogenase KduD [Maritalea mediterranea]
MSVFSLEGQRALVTGANTGIGQAIALGLAEAGAHVVAAGRSSCEETVERIIAEGGNAKALKMDLADGTHGVNALEKAGDLDILINNAGIIRREDSVDFSEADWDDVIDVNLKAVFKLSQHFAKSLMAREATGRIVNIASLLSYQGGIRVPSYTASKHGVVGLTKIFANEWAGRGINVNAVAPGYIATNNTQALRDDPKRSTEILERIPAGRWGDPADIAGAVTFLCTPAAQYVHGTVLNVDGGWLAR